MSPIAISVIVLACVFGGALLGALLRGMLPEHHLSAESKNVVKLARAKFGETANIYFFFAFLAAWREKIS